MLQELQCHTRRGQMTLQCSSAVQQLYRAAWELLTTLRIFDYLYRILVIFKINLFFLIIRLITPYSTIATTRFSRRVINNQSHFVQNVIGYRILGMVDIFIKA